VTVLEIVHETRYDYAAPVSLAHHLAHLKPLDDGAQRLLDFDLRVSPRPDQQRESIDAIATRSCTSACSVRTPRWRCAPSAA